VPGTLHQGILALFRDDPWLAFDLLGLERPVSGTPIDRRGEVDRDADGLLENQPGYPDLVLVHRSAKDHRRGIVICVEAQKNPDPEKRWRIPAYQALLADEYRLPTHVVVVSFSGRMSAALKAWSVGPPPRVDTLVIDARVVKPPASIQAARQRPTAAVLAAALHGYEGDIEAARLGVQVSRELPDKKRRRYTATILAALPEREADILRGELSVEERDELWEIERQSGTYKRGLRDGLSRGRELGRAQGLEQGREQGLEQGREQGLEQGREQGLERGRRMTLVELVLSVLEVRGVPVDRDSEAQIRSCGSVATLERWARRAREVREASELFAPP
jgi:hypothetical protein